MKKHVSHIINAHITAKLCTRVAHNKPIPHTKQNFEIPTDVIDNDVIMLKFEGFCPKALNCIAKGSISVVGN